MATFLCLLPSLFKPFASTQYLHYHFLTIHVDKLGAPKHKTIAKLKGEEGTLAGHIFIWQSGNLRTPDKL